MTLRRVVAALMSFVGAVMMVVCVAPASNAATTAVPYTDPNSTGLLGFCDAQGQPVTSGNINDQPFVWRAVASTPAPSGFSGSRARASLYAYQPIDHLDPGEWSGEQLTGSTIFSNADHPMAEATIGDNPLVSFVHTYPPDFDGYVQLRMYFSALDSPGYNETYPSADIKVTGSTWRLVRGGTPDCNAGKAVSVETLDLTKKQIARDVIGKPTASAGSTSTSSARASAGPPSPSSDAGSAAVGASSATASHGGRGWLVAALVILVAAVTAAAVALRRRRRAGAQP